MKARASLLAVLLMLSCASLAQTTAPAQQAAQQTVAESSKPEAASQPSIPSTSPVVATPSTDAVVVPAIDVPAVPVTPAFGPGAKVYIQPMSGFEERLAYSLTRKKVPVVLESDREKADFVMTGGAHVHKRGFFTGFVLSTKGKGSVWIEDARTGKHLWVYNFQRVDAMTTVDQIYQNWADSVANHLKKTMVKMEKK